MNKKTRILSSVFAFIGFLTLTSEASSTLLTFEDVSYGLVGSSKYGGFDWPSVRTTTNIVHSPGNFGNLPGVVNGVVSGENGAYFYANTMSTAGTFTVSRADDSVFDFNSAYFTSPSMYSASLLVTGVLNGLVLYTQSIAINSEEPTFFAFNFSGINVLKFKITNGYGPYAGHLRDFIMDDFVYNEIINPGPTPPPFTPAVPEPMTLALVGIGISGVVIGGRRRNDGINN